MAWPTEAATLYGPRLRAQRSSRTRRAAVLAPVLTAAFPRGVDALRVYGSGALSDGGSQPSLSANLGGYRSSTEISAFAAFGGLRSVVIERVFGVSTGVGSLESDGAGRLRWTAPGSSTPGPWTVAGGSSVILADGEDANAALRVSVSGTFPAAGARAVRILDEYNNGTGMSTVSHAERSVGWIHSRALFLRNAGLQAMSSIALFLTPLGAIRSAAAGYAAAGAVTVSGSSGAFADWPATGFCENEDTGEVVYYSARTDAALTVPAAGRDCWGDVSGGAAGTLGDSLVAICGLRIGHEAPSSQPSGSIQTIASESLSPAGIAWVHPHSFDDPDVLEIANLGPGQIAGLWLQRLVVAGSEAAAQIANDLTVEVLY